MINQGQKITLLYTLLSNVMLQKITYKNINIKKLFKSLKLFDTLI